MKIVIAPDSFKGSLSSQRLCHAISTAVRSIAPEADVIEIPLADGGEGTVVNSIQATGGTLHKEKVTGPIGQIVEATYGILGNGKTVVLEVAETSGLTLVPDKERNPLVTSSYGLGELIGSLLNKGYRDFIVGLGGSATNDGGMGMLRALGIQFLGEDGQPLPEGGGSLNRLADIDELGLNPAVHESVFTIACDVDNVLCGSQGASVVFGPQKGATPVMIQHLDASLAHFANCVLHQKGIQMLDIIGGGAAGGLGAAFVAFMGGKLKSGIDIMLENVDWESTIQNADLIVTGEGRLDHQTLSGKAIKGVCDSARKYRIPVIALAGSVELTTEQLKQLGVTSAFSIVPGPVSLDLALEHAYEWVQKQMQQVFQLWTSRVENK
ncbi:MAG: glycerate kinase [Candidatus Cohnella colombiensis]|uniref:Glycerate kinase n=1 Tax=Candidatus Cohnella colombiensis TaxID=3121368 RepID=A0AA95JC36_9BACL|nr:MAG: glycerate kinase [Cohnella sp.]